MPQKNVSSARSTTSVRENKSFFVSSIVGDAGQAVVYAVVLSFSKITSLTRENSLSDFWPSSNA
jgi:hypothetical protein